MEFALHFNLDNAAFDLDGDERSAEAIADVLIVIANRIRDRAMYLQPGDQSAIWDANGNRIGEWEVTLIG